MPKVKRGERENSSLAPMVLLDALAAAGIAPPIRLTALTILLTEESDPSLEYLSWRTGMTPEALSSHHFSVLEQSGFIKRDNSMIRLIYQPTRSQGKKRSLCHAERKVTMGDYANQAVREFHRLWARRYKQKCITDGKVRTVALRLVKELGFKEVKKRIENYLADDNPWVVERTHSFHIFAKSINQYVRRPNGKATGIISHSAGDFEAEVRAFEARLRDSES